MDELEVNSLMFSNQFEMENLVIRNVLLYADALLIVRHICIFIERRCLHLLYFAVEALQVRRLEFNTRSGQAQVVDLQGAYIFSIITQVRPRYVKPANLTQSK